MSKELQNIVAQMKALTAQAEKIMGAPQAMGKDEGAKKGVGASVGKQRHQKGVNYDTGVSDSASKGGKYNPENIKGGISTAGMKVRMGDTTGAKDKQKSTLADLKAQPKPALTKGKLGKGTPKTDDEESKPLPPGEAPSNDKPFEDASPEDQASDSTPAGKEAPAPEEPQMEDQGQPDVDQDGAPDESEDHGAIDPEQADQDGDGDVTHEEADAAAPGGGEQGDGYTYLAGDGDSIGARVGQAMLHDDVEGLHDVSNKINQGQQAFQQWLEGSGGEMISSGGDEFVARVPASADLSNLEEFRSQYNQMVGATVTIGTGHSMSQAGKALIWGKLNGKNQVAPYSEDMEQFLQGIQGQGDQDPNSEAGKQSDHYLNSVYGQQDQAAAPQDGAPAPEGQEDESLQAPAEGEEPMGDEAMGAPPADIDPDAAAAVDEEGEVPPVEGEPDMQDPLAQKKMMKDAPPAPGAPAPGMEADPEMDADDSASPIEGTMGDAMQGGDGSYLKQQMMQVLEGFKKDKEFIEALQGSQPEAYHETIALLHQMIKTAKILNALKGDAGADQGAPDQDDPMDNGGPLGDAMDEADMQDDAGAPPAPGSDADVEGEDDQGIPAEGAPEADAGADKKPFPPKKDGEKSDKKDDSKSDKKEDKKDSDKDGVPAKKDSDDKDKKKPFPNAGDKKPDDKKDK